MNKEVKRDNHYVSQSYLRAWSGREGKVWRYKLLVPHEKIPVWKQCSPKGVAYQRDLYTRLVNGEESDEFEVWCDQNIENPAGISLSKAISGEKLDEGDWKNLVAYLALQDIRTPARLLEFMERQNKTLPDLLERVLQKAKEKLEGGALNKSSFATSRTNGEALFPMRFMQEETDDPEQVRIGVETTIGRALWIWSLQHLIDHTSQVLHSHKWTIVRPCKGKTWPTSDNPVIRLNYYGDGSYDLKGGWGNDGTDLLLPLSPMHLMWTQVGRTNLPNIGSRLDEGKTNLLIKIIAESAHRTIFSSCEDQALVKLRPRRVDVDLVQTELREWSKWHDCQVEAEKRLGFSF